jgi:hypothetical protein
MLCPRLIHPAVDGATAAHDTIQSYNSGSIASPLFVMESSERIDVLDLTVILLKHGLLI